MESLEIPLGKRTKRYRFFEMLPALLSYTILLLPFVLSFFSPFLASIYVLLVIFGMFVKAIRIGWHTARLPLVWLGDSGGLAPAADGPGRPAGSPGAPG